jgi:hypothetical protein
VTYNLGNFVRTLSLPKATEPWSLTSLREKPIKPVAFLQKVRMALPALEAWRTLDFIIDGQAASAERSHQPTMINY